MSNPDDPHPGLLGWLTPTPLAEIYPARTFTLTCSPDGARMIVEDEFLIDGWGVQLALPDAGTVFSFGTLAPYRYLPNRLLSYRLPRPGQSGGLRGREYTLASVGAAFAGGRTVLTAAVCATSAGAHNGHGQEFFLAALERAEERFADDGLLVAAGPVIAATDLPDDDFAAPWNLARHLRDLV